MSTVLTVQGIARRIRQEHYQLTRQELSWETAWSTAANILLINQLAESSSKADFETRKSAVKLGQMLAEKMNPKKKSSFQKQV